VRLYKFLRRARSRGRSATPTLAELPELCPRRSPSCRGCRRRWSHRDGSTQTIIIPVYNQIAYHACCCLKIAADRAGARAALRGLSSPTIFPMTRTATLVGQIQRRSSGITAARPISASRATAMPAAAARRRRGQSSFLNNDTIPLSGLARRNWSTRYARDASIGLVGSRLLNSDGSPSGGWRHSVAGRPRRGISAVGRNALAPCVQLRQRTWTICLARQSRCASRPGSRLGGFDETFVPAYCEGFPTPRVSRVRRHGNENRLSARSPPSSTTRGVSHGRDSRDRPSRPIKVQNNKIFLRALEGRGSARARTCRTATT